MREALGVPTSWYGQYLSWLAGMLQGNFGTSIRTGLPVLGEVFRVGLNTLILTLGSMLVTLLIAVPIALYSAVRGVNAVILAAHHVRLRGLGASGLLARLYRHLFLHA